MLEPGCYIGSRRERKPPAKFDLGPVSFSICSTLIQLFHCVSAASERQAPSVHIIHSLLDKDYVFPAFVVNFFHFLMFVRALKPRANFALALHKKKSIEWDDLLS